MQTSSAPGLLRDAGLAATALAAVIAVSALGQLATYPNLAPWYAGLEKPSFNPPNWVFAPVWTALYALMAFALWRILRRPASTPGRTLALTLFFVMLALNTSWSWMFFAARSPMLGLVNIVPQLAVVVATLAVASRIDRPAGLALAPLSLWVAFAAVLNFEIWRLN